MVCALLHRGPSRSQEAVGERLGGDSFPAGQAREPRETIDLILQKVFPSGPGAEGSSAWPERLKLVLDRVTAKVKDAATTVTIQALAMVKSHYPFADLKRFKAGYAAGTDEDKLDALTSEVEPTAETLVELLDLDDL